LTEISFQLTAQSVKDSKGDEQQAIRIQIQQSIRRLDYFFKRNQDEREKLLFWLESSQETQILEIQQLSLPEEIDRQILLVLLELQQNVCSLAANDLPMLLLPNDLKEAIRTQELPCHHAKAIAKLSSKILKISEDEIRKLRSQIVQKVILESLSLRETKEAVTRIISEQGASLEKAPQKKEFNQIKTILADISLPNLQKQELKSLKKTLTAKLAEIENLLTKGETKPLS
jgi:hypothetical protein